MARYTRLFFSIAFAFVLAPLLAIGDAVSFVARSVVDLYSPSAIESLAIDRMVAPVAVIPALRSRFRAFTETARNHADFCAGHFDPARLAA